MNNFEKYSNLEKGRFIYFLEPHAEPEWIDTKLSETSINPVQNLVIFSKFKQLEGAINAESERAGEVELRLRESIDWVKSAAALVGGNAFSATENEVKLTTTGLDIANQYTVTLPAATAEKAGVMSAEDKAKLDNITTGGDVTTEQLEEAIEKGRQLALRSLFVAAGAEYNDTDQIIKKTAPWGETVQHLPKHYYLNGLGDITEEQMMEIYNAGKVMQDVAGLYNSNKKIRTNFPSLHSTSSGYSRDIDGRGMFCGCTMLEVAIISTNIDTYNKITVRSDSAQFVFFNCPKVRYISRLSLEGGTSTTNMFGLCSSLSHVEIRSLSTNLSFINSPLIDKESILYLIQNNKAKSAITITLHADAYARLANDTDIVAALDAKNTELASSGGSINLASA